MPANQLQSGEFVLDALTSQGSDLEKKKQACFHTPSKESHQKNIHILEV